MPTPTQDAGANAAAGELHAEGCRVEVGFGDERPPVVDEDGDLHVQGDRLLLSYWDDQGAVVFVGEREGERFNLMARSRPRRGELRRESASVFIGAWAEGSDGGSLRVVLPESVTPESPST